MYLKYSPIVYHEYYCRTAERVCALRVKVLKTPSATPEPSPVARSVSPVVKGSKKIGSLLSKNTKKVHWSFKQKIHRLYQSLNVHLQQIIS